jgi:hypothetical protein
MYFIGRFILDDLVAKGAPGSSHKDAESNNGV